MEGYIIYPADHFTDSVLDCFYPKNNILPGFPLMWDSMNHIRVRPQELSVWAGINGHGKSMIVSMVALMAAYHKEKTVIASFEMTAQKTLGRMVLQALGEPNPSRDLIRDCLSWMKEYIFIYHFVGRGDVNSMRSNFETA